MKLHEHQARKLLSEFSIPVPRGIVASSVDEAISAFHELGGPVVVKAQVLSGGRGKAGGVVLANNEAAVESAAKNILRLEIGGYSVKRLLITDACEISKEIYLSALIDRNAGAIAVMASSKGGMDIEEVALQSPELIMRRHVDYATGLPQFMARELGFELGLDWDQVKEFQSIASNLVELLKQVDASLVEINPLIVDGEGHCRAIDAKIDLDDNAMGRHPELENLRNPEEYTREEIEARNAGISYIKLDGNIGCMVNGAGLAMALLDVIKGEGGEPANFLDVGGGADSVQVRTAMNIILSDPTVRVILINIFGGITRCDEVANGVIEALGSISKDVDLVVRLVGTNEDEGLSLLKTAGISAHSSMVEAVKQAVELAS